MKKYILFAACLAAALLASSCGKSQYKYSVFDTCLGPQYASNVESLDKAKSLGFDGVQLSRWYKPGGVFMDADLIAKYKAKKAQTGMETPSLVVPNLPFIDNPDCVRFMKSAIDAAAELNAKTILVAFFGKLKLSDENKKLIEAKFEPLVASLKQIMPYAEQKGVLVCMENTLSADENNRVIDAVGSQNLKVYFDVFNIVYYGHEEISSIEKLKGRIGEIHLKDKGHKLGSSGEMPKDFKACIAAIKRIGYKGWLCMELHAFKYKESSPDETLKYNLKYAKENF